MTQFAADHPLAECDQSIVTRNSATLMPWWSWISLMIRAKTAPASSHNSFSAFA